MKCSDAKIFHFNLSRLIPVRFVIFPFCICVHLCLSVVQNLAMLTTLRIKNLALVSDLTLELQPGCNVITGETGAGKSIIIGALNLVLGERADRSLIRSGGGKLLRRGGCLT